MAHTSIEWTNCTWNPVAGCSLRSPGCARCYALRMAHRLAAMGQEKYAGTTAKVNDKLVWTGELRCDEQVLDLPQQWKRPRRIFVNSMSDLFHENVPLDFILRIFDAMRRATWHQYQILTKRAERLLQLDPFLPWIPSIWMGVSVEDAAHLQRRACLRQTSAEIKFLSLEPLLGPLPGLNLTGIDWIIVGGESGPGARPIKPEWVRDIRDQCQAAHLPFFFKQWGQIGNNPDPRDATARENGGMAKGGCTLDGRIWNEMPGGDLR
jgi:protein gp37